MSRPADLIPMVDADIALHLEIALVLALRLSSALVQHAKSALREQVKSLAESTSHDAVHLHTLSPSAKTLVR